MTGTVDPAARPVWKPMDGWWCPCVGPDAGMGHHAAECVRRVRIRTWIPSYPDWRPPRARWLDDLEPDDDGAEERAQAPIVPCLPLADALGQRLLDSVPAAAGRLLARVQRIDPAARLTYAKGWGRKLQVIGYEPEEQGGGEIKGFRPWPVESVALRSRVLAVAWTRREGDAGWSGVGGYGVWGGRIWPVKPTQADALIKALEEA